MPNLLQRSAQNLAITIAMLENATGYRSIREATSDMAAITSNEMAYLYRFVTKPQFDYALDVYAHAGMPDLGFLILGRQQNPLFDIRVSNPEFPMIDFDLIMNLGVLNENLSGSILRSANWTVYMNDMFILGGIANRMPFYLASARDEFNLWDWFADRSTLFAREIAGLFMAGYEIKRLADGSEVMYPPSNRTVSLNLQEYMKKLPAFWKTGSARRLMADPTLIKMIYRSSNNSVIRVRSMPEP